MKAFIVVFEPLGVPAPTSIFAIARVASRPGKEVDIRDTVATVLPLGALRYPHVGGEILGH